MPPSNYDVEVFAPRLGRFLQIDASSDADDILDRFTRDQDAMRFRITYSGDLKAGGKKPRLEEKAAVRAAISPQLAELWQTHPALSGVGLTYQMLTGGWFLRGSKGGPAMIDQPVQIKEGQERIKRAIADPILVAGRPFLPLVRKSLHLTCGLDILFLRKDGPGPLIAEGGDLDNRVKTLFDGLRVPQPGEVKGPAEQDAPPTYCLLEDDALITDFTVRTDRLLTKPGAPESEVLLVIDVAVKATRLSTDNIGFLGD